MSELTPRARERALFLYRNALERGDFDTVARILHLAERDSILEGMIFELSLIDEANSSATPPLDRTSRGIKMIVTIRRRLSPDGWPPKPNSNEENDSMNIVLEPQKLINRQARYYLTLAAAVVVFILLGGIVFDMIPRLPFRTLTPPRTPSLAVITPENADQIQFLGFLGRGTITDMAWSPDGSALALGSTPSGIIWLYAPGDLNAEPRWLPGNPGGVTQLAFSADGKTLASVGLEPIVRIWDVATGTERAHFEPDPFGTLGFTRVALSGDAKLLAVISSISKNVKILDTVTGVEIITLNGHSLRVTAIAFSPDAKLLISGSDDKTVLVWDVATGTQLGMLEGHDDAVTSVAFNPDGGMFASGTRDGTVQLWDWNGAAGTIGLGRRGHEKAVDKLTFSPDGRLLASAGFDNTIRLWNMDTSSQQAILTGHTDQVRGIAFSPDGKTLASVSQDRTLLMWDVASGAQVNSVDIPRADIGGVSMATFSPDGRTIASGGYTGQIALWDVATVAQKLAFEGHGSSVVWGLDFSPDGTTLVSGGDDRKVRLWDVATGTLKADLIGSNMVAFNPDGTLIVAGSPKSDGIFRVWNAQTGEVHAVLNDHKNWVFDVDFSPDGTLFASNNFDNTVGIWDVLTGNRLATLGNGGSPTKFSPVGSMVTYGSSDRSIHLWDIAAGEDHAVFHGYLDAIYYLAFSPDGRLMVTAGASQTWGGVSSDPTIRVWDTSTGEQLHLISDHKKSVISVNFSPNGTMFVSTSEDGTIRLWGVPNGD